MRFFVKGSFDFTRIEKFLQSRSFVKKWWYKSISITLVRVKNMLSQTCCVFFAWENAEAARTNNLSKNEGIILKNSKRIFEAWAQSDLIFRHTCTRGAYYKKIRVTIFESCFILSHKETPRGFWFLQVYRALRVKNFSFVFCDNFSHEFGFVFSR